MAGEAVNTPSVPAFLSEELLTARKARCLFRFQLARLFLCNASLASHSNIVEHPSVRSPMRARAHTHTHTHTRSAPCECVAATADQPDFGFPPACMCLISSAFVCCFSLMMTMIMYVSDDRRWLGPDIAKVKLSISLDFCRLQWKQNMQRSGQHQIRVKSNCESSNFERKRGK